MACHMQTVAATDAAYLKTGSHTFRPSYTSTAPNVPGDLVAACQNCHGSEITSFDFPLFDYDGDGAIDGGQAEVQHLLDQLSTLLPPAGATEDLAHHRCHHGRDLSSKRRTTGSS